MHHPGAAAARGLDEATSTLTLHVSPDGPHHAAQEQSSLARGTRVKNQTLDAVTWDFCCSSSPFVFNPISVQLIYIYLTEPKWYFPTFWISKQKLLTVFNHPFVAVNRALFSLPNFFFLLHAHSRVCYCKVAHWDEGWAAGRDWGLAEKRLKYRVVG